MLKNRRREQNIHAATRGRREWGARASDYIDIFEGSLMSAEGITLPPPSLIKFLEKNIWGYWFATICKKRDYAILSCIINIILKMYMQYELKLQKAELK